MTVNISGQVPAEAQNGMVRIEEDWLGDRTPDPIVAVVIIERAGFKFDDATQERRATMKFKHIEPIVVGTDLKTAREILEYACKQRGGEVYEPPEPDTELDIPDDDERIYPLGDPFDDGGDAA